MTKNLTMEEKIAKPVVIIPGMDHSQFCSPFNVSGDLQPEISNEEGKYLKFFERITKDQINLIID